MIPGPPAPVNRVERELAELSGEHLPRRCRHCGIDTRVGVHKGDLAPGPWAKLVEECRTPTPKRGSDA